MLNNEKEINSAFINLLKTKFICIVHTNICIYRHRKKVFDEKKKDKIKCNITELMKILKSQILWTNEHQDKYTLLFKIIFTS